MARPPVDDPNFSKVPSPWPTFFYPEECTPNPDYVEQDPKLFEKLQDFIECSFLRYHKLPKGHVLPPPLFDGIPSLVLRGIRGIGKNTTVHECIASCWVTVGVCIRISAHNIERDFEAVCHRLKLQRDTWPLGSEEQKRKEIKSLIKSWLYRPFLDFGEERTWAGSWLLVLEDAATPEQLDEWLPADGPGAIIITTTNLVSPWPSSEKLDIQPLLPWRGRDLLIDLTKRHNVHKDGYVNRGLAKFYRSKVFCERVSQTLGNIPGAIEMMSCATFGQWDATLKLLTIKLGPASSLDLWRRSGIKMVYDKLADLWFRNPGCDLLIYFVALGKTSIPELVFYNAPLALTAPSRHAGGPWAFLQAQRGVQRSQKYQENVLEMRRLLQRVLPGYKALSKAEYEEARDCLLRQSLARIHNPTKPESELSVSEIVQEVYRNKIGLHVHLVDSAKTY